MNSEEPAATTIEDSHQRSPSLPQVARAILSLLLAAGLFLSSVPYPLRAQSTTVYAPILRAQPDAEFRYAQAQGLFACPATELARTTVLLEDGGRVDWSPVGDLIAFDRAGEDGFYDVHVMRPDGAGIQCLTCDKAGLPQKHNGNPAWHPSGEYLVFQSEMESHYGSSTDALPGFGRYSDLWLASADGAQMFRLTNGANSWNQGVLHARFSPDGRRLAWSEMVQAPWLLTKGQEFGYWQVKLADFALVDGAPVLSNVQSLVPGGKPAFYETHGFAPDGASLLFASNYAREGSALLNTDIFRLELASGVVSRLTDSHYNEHAQFSPDGAWIVWMSTRENYFGGTDYWLMRVDGSDKVRLSGFNHAACPEYGGSRLTAADVSWSPRGDALVAYVQTNLTQQTGKIVLLELRE